MNLIRLIGKSKAVCGINLHGKSAKLISAATYTPIPLFKHPNPSFQTPQSLFSNTPIQLIVQTSPPSTLLTISYGQLDNTFIPLMALSPRQHTSAALPYSTCSYTSFRHFLPGMQTSASSRQASKSGNYTLGYHPHSSWHRHYQTLHNNWEQRTTLPIAS